MPPTEAKSPRGRRNLVPYGTCPNCKSSVPVDSESCPGCQASFGQEAAWSIAPNGKLGPPRMAVPVLPSSTPKTTGPSNHRNLQTNRRTDQASAKPRRPMRLRDVLAIVLACSLATAGASVGVLLIAFGINMAKQDYGISRSYTDASGTLSSYRPSPFGIVLFLPVLGLAAVLLTIPAKCTSLARKVALDDPTESTPLTDSPYSSRAEVDIQASEMLCFVCMLAVAVALFPFFRHIVKM